jgi:two-component system, NarL family, response regulator NreC
VNRPAARSQSIPRAPRAGSPVQWSTACYHLVYNPVGTALPRILLADDHVIVRQGLKSLLQQEGFQVVGEASDGREAVKLAQELRPDIVILDVSMPILNGVDAATEILKSVPTKVILLTMHTEHPYVISALSAGVSGYLVKSKAADSLITAINEVLRGNTYLSPDVSRSVVDTLRTSGGAPPEPLSSRERQVLQLIAEGMSTKEVASVLCISVKTAESHRTRIMQRLNIHDTATLVLYAIRQGLIQP